MGNEPFWSNEYVEGVDIYSIEQADITYEYVEKNISYAVIDNALYELMKDIDSSQILIETLVSQYINHTEQDDMKAKNSVDSTVSQNLSTKDNKTKGKVPFCPLKEEFKDFLYKKNAVRTADGYVSILDNTISKLIADISSQEINSLFQISNSDEIESYLKIFLDNSEFVKRNERSHNKLTSSIRNYIKFLKSRDN